MSHNPVGWFEIYVDDMPRAKQFYETVLDTQLEQLPDPTGGDIELWSFAADMEKFGATGALVKMDGVKAGGNSTMVYFSCDDCAVEESRIQSAGGQVQQAKMPIGEHGFISMGLDTEGNIFGLHSRQ